MKNFTHLEDLHLHHNNISIFPEFITQYADLRNLHLSFNSIRSLPSDFNRLTQLQFLYIQSVVLEALPDPFGPFPFLRVVDMRSNQLHALPNQIQSCPNLDEWKLNNNFLDAIPASIINCPRLRFIHLANNQFTELPDVMTQLNQSIFWSFENNPLRPPFDFIYDEISHLDGSHRREYNQPAKYLNLWKEFPENLLASLRRNRSPPKELYTLILHSTMGGFCLQKCATIKTPAARRYVARLTEEYGKIKVGKYDIYLSL